MSNPSPASREREGPRPQGWEEEGSSSPAGLPSLASLREAPSPAMRPAMRERGLDSGLYRVLTWFSPGFPVGAFSYSHGLEAAAERGTCMIARLCDVGSPRSLLVAPGGWMPTPCARRIEP